MFSDSLFQIKVSHTVTECYAHSWFRSLKFVFAKTHLLPSLGICRDLYDFMYYLIYGDNSI